MRKLGRISALVLVLAFVLAPVAEASVSMVWSRFLAVKADRVLVTTDDSVGAPSAQTAGTVVIESGGNTPALSISGYAGQTEPLVYLEDGAGTEVFAIGPAGELTTTGAMSLGDATVNGDMVITGTLDAQGYLFDSTGYLSLEDDIDFNGTMVNTDGAVTLGDSVVITDALQVDGRVTVNANATVTGTLDVQNYIYNSLGALYVFGDQDLYGYLYSTNGPVGISDNVVVTGTMDVQGSIADSGSDLAINDSVAVSGFLYHSIDVTAVTTDTAPLAGVSGTWFKASGANTTIMLPAAAEGLYFCVYNYAGDDTYIDVQTGDQLHALTNAAGDRVTNTTAGDSICLLAIDTQYWIATQTKGTWTDAD